MNTFANPNQSQLELFLAPLKVSLIKYWHYSLFPALALLGIALILSFRLPNYFTSDAMLFIQPQRLNLNLIDSPESSEMGERFDALMFELLSREKVAAIIEQHKVYPNEKGASGRANAIKRFRKAINISPVLSPSGKQLLQTFHLTFTHTNPNTAYHVVKQVTDLFIRESTVSRVGELQATKEFLSSQLKEAQKKLEETEKKIEPFIRSNFGKLPEHLDQAIARLDNQQARLESNTRLLSANIQRRTNLQNELELIRQSEAAPGGAANNEGGGTPSQRLARLEAYLEVLKSRYTDKHPEVAATQERIRALRRTIAGGSSSAKTTRMSSLELSLTRQIHEVDVEINKLKQENKSLKKTIATLETNIKEMPSKEQELVAIKRGYENDKANYERLRRAQQEAELQSRLNLTQRGAKFKVVDAAALPTSPSFRPGLLALGVGILGSILLFLGIPMAIYFLGNTFKLSSELERDTDLPVLEMIPPIETHESKSKRNQVLLFSFLGSLFCFLAAGSAAAVYI